MENIICLDIDDCIFLNNQSYIGVLDDNFDLLEINLKRLQKIISSFDAKIFITSSWSSILKLENNNIIYNNKGIYNPNLTYYQEEFKAFELISKYLNGHIIGLSCGNRFKDIKNLIKDKNNKVVAIDDSDLSEIKEQDFNDNYLFVYTNGLITNREIYNIYNFYK